jgi:hypothetical protein
MDYMGDSLDKFIQTFLPKKTKIVFKDHNTKNRISDAAGVVSFTHIKNHEKGIQVTLADILNHKYKYTEKIGEESIFFQSRPEIEIKHLNERKKIAGYSCKKAEISYPKSNNSIKNFTIYYTDKIAIEGFTNNTPFEEIDGVLMEFQVEIYQIPMRLKAVKVQQKNISDSEFEIPSGYKTVNKKSMQEIIEFLKER